MNNDLLDCAKSINGKDSFLKFMLLLIDDFKNNKTCWENQDLLPFLEAASAWIHDMEAFYANQGVAMPANIDWKVFADILLAARVYE
jgi:hypothetical protein